MAQTLPRVDTLEQMCSPVPSKFSVPATLHPVWAFQGKSLPAVKSMSAPLTVQTVSREGSVEPSQEGRCTCLTACLLSGLGLCTRIRTAGQAETGTASSVRNASGHRTSRFLSAMVDGQARWLKEESPGFIQGSVNPSLIVHRACCFEHNRSPS